MIIDEVAQLKRKTIKTLPVPESTRLMSTSVPGPACRAADLCVKPNGSNTCLNLVDPGGEGSCQCQCLYGP